MISPSTFKSKKEDKTAIEKEPKLDSFKKDDIQRIFKEKDTRRISYLTRAIATELGDKNVKMKKLTKLFLSEFNGNVEKVPDMIVNGAFISLFNVIIILVLKDSKHYGFNVDFQSIKKSLLSMKLERGKSMEETSFWNCFER